MESNSQKDPKSLLYKGNRKSGDNSTKIRSSNES